MKKTGTGCSAKGYRTPVKVEDMYYQNHTSQLNAA